MIWVCRRSLPRSMRSSFKDGCKNSKQVELIVAKININFIGPWRLFLGVRAVETEVNSIDEARQYIETQYGPVYQEKLKSRGSKMQPSIWDSSNILLNGRNIKQLDEPVLKDGDNLDLLLIVAGG